MTKVIMLLLLMYPVCIRAEMLDFFQNEYDITMHIAECVWYNHTLYNFCHVAFVLFNRTQRVLNASFELLYDLGADMLVCSKLPVIDVQMYKMMSNEYRFFPVTVRVNACAEYQRNTFRAQELVARHSDLTPCNVTARTYHVYNGMPDTSKFPPHMPRGNYKIVVNFTYHGMLLAEMDLYGSIKDKPFDWKKIPKKSKKP